MADRNVRWTEAPIVVIDVETTGLDPLADRIVEVGVAMWDPEWNERRSWRLLVNPEIPIPTQASDIHGITDLLVRGASRFPAVGLELEARIPGHAIVAAYNVDFDRRLISHEWARSNRRAPWFLLASEAWLDPLVWVRETQKYERSKKLVDVAARMGVQLIGAHSAENDAKATLEIILRLGGSLPARWGDIVDRQKLLQAEDRASYMSWLQKQPEERRARG